MLLGYVCTPEMERGECSRHLVLTPVPRGAALSIACKQTSLTEIKQATGCL